jgi:hypothetical protein
MLSSSPQALQNTLDLGFQYSLPPFPPICGNCMPITYSRLSSNPLQPHQSIRSVVFHFSFLLPFWQSLFCILSLFVPSVCSHHLNLCECINFTMPAPCNISCISLCLFPSFLHLLSNYQFAPMLWNNRSSETVS